MRFKFSIFVIASLLFNACVEERDLTTNTVVVQISYTPDGLHPTNGNAAMKSIIHAYTQRYLMDTDPETDENKAILIKQLPSVDSSGLIYAFELREDVKWDNGNALSVDDVIFSCKTLLCPLTNNAEVRPIYKSIIDSVYQDDSEPNKFYMKAKTKHVLNGEILSGVPIQQEAFWDPNKLLQNLHFKAIHAEQFQSNKALDIFFNAFNNADNAYLPQRLTGLGPYQVSSFSKNNFITLTRKTNWWGDDQSGIEYENYPEKIIFKVIKKASSVFLAIKNQEIDFTSSAGGTSKLLSLQKLDYFNGAYKSEFVPGYSYSYLGMNMRPDESKQIPFFTDQKTRRAIAHLIPVEEIIEVMTYGKAQRQASIVSPLKNSCDTTLQLIDLNFEKANALLAEAGWKDTDGDQVLDKVINGKKTPFSFKLNYISRGSSKEIVFMMKESLAKAGIELVANPMDFSSLYQKASNHQFDAMLGGWVSGSSYSDPTQLWSTESWSNKGSNFCGFGSKESDELIIKANTSLDAKEHLEAYQKLQKMIYEEQPYVFLWSGKSPMVAHRRFENTKFFKTLPYTSLGSYKLAQ